MKILICAVAALIVIPAATIQAATFSIDNIRVHEQAQASGDGIMVQNPEAPSNHQAQVYIPQIEVDVKISEQAQSKNLLAKAYFFDEAGKPVATMKGPAVAQHFVGDGLRNNSHPYAWPTLVPPSARQQLFFPLPVNLPANWTVLVVFGNANGAVAATVPDGQEQMLDYPEKQLVAKTQLSPDVALTDAAPAAALIEEKVDSDNPRYPAFTLLMHLPHGVSSAREVNGVLAVCTIADSVAQIRDRLNAIKPTGDPNPYFAFAESHKLAVVAWGSRWVWSSYANFDELNRYQIRAWDDNFQQLADAWDRGIEQLVQNYGLPDHDYLMYGLCAGGEWVHRLALHKPDRFLAVQMHISTSYDEPTPEASRIMWLLTTGEMDVGCDRARRFYAAARAMEYPIIFKAVIGVGHADSPVADQLGVRFFEYALAEKARRDAANANDLARSQPLDLSAFSASPYYGDLMNQDVFAARDKDMIPPGFLVPLPDKDIADAWNK
jgi:hypothetical protein